MQEGYIEDMKKYGKQVSKYNKPKEGKAKPPPSASPHPQAGR